MRVHTELRLPYSTIDAQDNGPRLNASGVAFGETRQQRLRVAHDRVRAAVHATASALLLSVLTIGPTAAQDTTSARPTMRADGTIPMRAYDLPISRFLTPPAREAFIQWTRRTEGAMKGCPTRADTEEKALAMRRCVNELFAPLLAKQKARYDVRIESDTIGGIYAEVFTPAGGVSRQNQGRVLINVHGGGFILGARTISQIEAIPIAAAGKIKVVSVDYRMGPEHKFPAASQDVAAVYREILKRYNPKNVGIYGCSAGGVLTAQALSWFQKEGLPMPGAAGMFCAAASYWDEGDSGYFINGSPAPPNENPYLRDADFKDPLVFPINAPEVLAKFPPSLLVVSTRDFALSSVVHTHSELVKHGVAAELHVWEGLGHAFFMDPDFPQSREMYEVTVKFFDRHLGRD